MKINTINSNIKFASHYTNVDIGASSILGSFKIAIVDDKGNLIAKNYGSTVFAENEERSEDKFERNVAKKIADFKATLKRKITKNLTKVGNENILKDSNRLNIIFLW